MFAEREPCVVICVGVLTKSVFQIPFLATERLTRRDDLYFTDVLF